MLQQASMATEYHITPTDTTDMGGCLPSDLMFYTLTLISTPVRFMLSYFQQKNA